MTIRYRQNQGSLRLDRMSAIERLFYKVFLPIGYPDSVSADYWDYQLWDSVQALASSVMMALSMAACLEGYGVGSSDASVYASTITWLFKDGVGMIGRLASAWYISSDVNIKKWRMIADICNDGSFLIEMLIPWKRNSRVTLLLIFSSASLMRAVVGVAGGAVRAKVAEHQARQKNVADVMAKDSSQEVLVNLVSLAVNFIIIWLVQSSRRKVYTVMALCLMIHLYSNYKLVRSLQLDSINLNRLSLMTEKYLCAVIIGFEHMFQTSPDMSIAVINQEEPILQNVEWNLIPLRIADQSMDSFADDDKERILQQLQRHTAATNYNGETFSIVLRQDFQAVDLLKACFTYCLYNISRDWAGKRCDEAKKLLSESTIDNHFPAFLDILKKQRWNLSNLDIPIGSCRISLDKTD